MCGKIKFIKILMIAFIGLYPTIASCQHVTEKIFLASDRMNYGLGIPSLCLARYVLPIH